METVVLDGDILAQLERDATAARLPRLIEIYISELTRRTDQIAAALDAEDLSSIEYETHALRSSSGTFGAIGLQQCAADTEEACLGGNAERAKKLALQVLDLARETESQLRERYPAPEPQ
jgi:HPt (histidine-containing phosphotransfer) domain-containing protein